jgi:hypothetical protein
MFPPMNPTAKAKECLNHAQQRAGTATPNDKERHDLYAGLYNIVLVLEELQNEISALRQQVDGMSRRG